MNDRQRMRRHAGGSPSAEFLDGLLTIIQSSAAAEQLLPAAIDRLAPRIVRAVQQHFGGRRVYVGKCKQSAQELAADLAKLLAAGKSMQDAAARKGISRATAYRVLQRSAHAAAKPPGVAGEASG